MFLKSHRVLIVSRNFPPLIGGMERLILNVYKELSLDYSCDVIGPTGSDRHLSENSHSVACPVKPVSLFIICTFFKGLLLHINNRYDFYFAGSGVTSPLVILFAKLFKKKSVIYLHGLDIIANSRFYQIFFVPFFRYADSVIVNSRNTAKLAVDKGVLSERISIINPGVDIPEQQLDPRGFIQRHGLVGKKILLSVGRIIPRKGLAEFVTHSLSDIVRQDSSCSLVVIGGEAYNALKKNSDSIDMLLNAIKYTGLEENVVLLGYAEESELKEAYAAADVFVFPLLSIPGDVEGFGMVAVEAAAHGVPTVAFDTGGVADAVKDGVSGILIKPLDYYDFTIQVLKILSMPDYKSESMRRDCYHHATNFSWPVFGKKIRNLFSRVHDK